MGDNITELLLSCEKEGIAPPYVVNPDTYKTEKYSIWHESLPLWTEPLRYQSDKEDVFVVSDLHIASGRNDMGIYKGTENFFADEAFARFLSYAAKVKKTEQALLVINGDIFDFIRTTEYPGKVKVAAVSKRLTHLVKFGEFYKAPVAAAAAVKSEYDEWSDELQKCGIIKTPAQLEASVSNKEKKYGLETDAYKTIYKLIRIKRGHPAFFKALSQWLEDGNKIMIVKGNHDLEFYWPAVRNYFRIILGELMAKQGNLQQVLIQKVLPAITFIDDAVVVDNTLFIEHGHRYDKFTMVLSGPALQKTPDQINIPFGSFFNRYLINRVELYYPNLDKVRPAGNILPMLVKEDFPLALKILGLHLPFMVRVLFKNPAYLRFMFGRLFWWFIVVMIPVTVIAVGVCGHIDAIKKAMSSSFVDLLKKGGITTVLGLIPAYLLARIVAWFQLEEPSSLNDYAKKVFTGKPYKIVVMGHTHNPGAYSISPNCRFYNTGTWIPVIEISTAEVREDRTYTFLHLSRNEQGELTAVNKEMLERWNDDAGRPDPQILVERKA